MAIYVIKWQSQIKILRSDENYNLNILMVENYFALAMAIKVVMVRETISTK